MADDGIVSEKDKNKFQAEKAERVKWLTIGIVIGLMAGGIFAFIYLADSAITTGFKEGIQQCKYGYVPECRVLYNGTAATNLFIPGNSSC